MSKINVKRVAPVVTNHHGIAAVPAKPFEELWRTVLTCLLWEDGFYESGEVVADRIKRLVPLCKPHEVAQLAIEARERHHLRHVPLLLVRELARDSKRFSVAETLAKIIQRPDELSEFVALYWKDGKKPLAAQVKKGLAYAFRKFDEYRLAKYNRDSEIKLRDVLFLCHAKPMDEKQASLWKRLVDGQLETPDTWEVALSAGADKRETFERLLAEKKLGYMALLRNLRNMADACVSTKLIGEALEFGAAKSKALPFRFLAAARAVPAFEPMIDNAMMLALDGQTKLPGKTAVLIDVSGSMDAKLSSKSDLNRLDAAKALAILLRGVCEEVRVFIFNNAMAEVPPRQGMALADAIGRAGGGTMLGAAVNTVNRTFSDADRLIVFTDEESQDRVPAAKAPKAYMVNVATTKNSIAHGPWVRIGGFSEAVVQYIQALEGSNSL